MGRRIKKPAAALADRETDKLFGRDAEPDDAPELPSGAQQIVDHIFDVDLFADYQAAVDELTTSDDALRLDMTRPEADKAQARALRAHRLYCNAVMVVNRFMRDSEVTSSAMYEAAAAELQAEKDAKIEAKKAVGKAISNSDVRNRAAQMFPQQWRRASEDVEKAELMRDHLKRLADLWKDRSFTLGDIVRTGRR